MRQFKDSGKMETTSKKHEWKHNINHCEQVDNESILYPWVKRM